MNCQIDKFIIEGNTTYLNCAYMSPMLKIVEEAGINGLKTKRAPHNILPEDFFSGVNALKKAFAKLINLDEHERIAISSSVSYGLANITNNIQLKESDNIILIGDQFPSNVYPWMELTKKYNANLKFINKPNSENNAGRAWNKKILNSINKQTKVVAMGLLHWADGTIYDIEKIRKKTKEVDALLIIDGTQSIGVMPFDIKETQPDALICAGYKWLMGPYGIGLSYYGPFFDNGKPIEESWINRKNSEDFSNLINYEDEYGEYARRYSVGQQSNFINISMLKAGIDQLNHWGIENVYKYIESITTPCFPLLNKKNTWYEDSKFRSSHLFGIRPKKNLKKILEKIRENNIFISLRGDIIRVSPSVYNTKEDVQKLFECISENA
tara:strand:- start:1110 stop:2255 length:1146 start_codon:yes stop_codon:yes gene_type:complete